MLRYGISCDHLQTDTWNTAMEHVQFFLAIVFVMVMMKFKQLPTQIQDNQNNRTAVCV